MARANLRGLIGNLGDTEAPDQSNVPEEARPAAVATAAPEGPPEPSPPGAVQAQEVIRESQPARLSERDAPGPAVALYSDFQRKETRLRADQQNALTEHARQLNRAKGPGGRRITDNTLIRVAVDLLLSKTDKLAGRSETELRGSVGLKGTER
jgi:hypothetical protein